MLIEQYIVTVRRQLTGESLAGARRRLFELPDWSAPVPAARNSNQQRLESYLLQALGQGHGRHPLGISEIVPFADRLVLRLESEDLIEALLPLLPYRDGRRSRHGVADLRAAAQRRGIELVLGRSGDARVLLLGPRGCDLGMVLAAYAAAVEGRRHAPLWTEETRHDPLPRPLTRARSTRASSKSRGQMDAHAAEPGLASALLRRLHLWEGLASASTVTVTSQSRPDERGLAWTVERRLPQQGQLHDPDVSAVLAESVAGLGLTTDTGGHRCDLEACIQTFAAGRLNVRAVRGENTRTAQRHTRSRARLASALLCESQAAERAARTSSTGHVLQLISPWAESRTDTAEQLAAAWAQQGLRTLVLQVDSWDRRSETLSWRRSRLTGGSGAMFEGRADFVHGDLKCSIAKARAEFDHVIMIKRQWVDVPTLGFSPLADDHLVVTDSAFPRTTKSTTVHGGRLQRRTINLSPTESAVAWLNSRLSRIPYGDFPMVGLLLQCADDKSTPDAFDSKVDEELSRHGMPVLGRLPLPPRGGHRRTVLDHLPDDERAFLLSQANQVRKALSPAGTGGTAFITALREYAEF